MTHSKMQHPMNPADNGVIINEKDHVVEMIIFGQIHSPESYCEEIQRLFDLSERYQTLTVKVAGPGGSAATLMEFYNAIKRYSQVITIASSSISSACSMLWAIGDIRVIEPTNVAMFHRESFGFWGKTEQHIDHASKFNETLSTLFDQMVSDVLTPEERERAKVTEIYKSGKELIEAGNAISTDTYYNTTRDPSLIPVGQVLFDRATNKTIILGMDGTTAYEAIVAPLTKQFSIVKYGFGTIVPEAIELPETPQDEKKKKTAPRKKSPAKKKVAAKKPTNKKENKK